MKILIIDDHSLFREGLTYVLNELDKQVTVLEASNFDQALQHLAESNDLELVLLDLNLPGKDGFALLNMFSEKYPTLPVVIVSGSNQHSDVQRAMDSGAMGYIPKECTSQVMLNALKLIMAGGIYVPPELMQQDSDISTSSGLDSLGLTDRQRQVLALLAGGQSNKEIAKSLNLAEPTVKMHVTAILKAMGVTNRTQAAMAAEKLGLG